MQTPTIDRLAADGIRFRNAFVTTSICAASRATLFTGLTERTHAFTFGTPPIARHWVIASYPALLKANGYRTGFVGKFGVNIEGNNPAGVMFDWYKPLNRSPYVKKAAGRHVTDMIGDEAIGFVESTAKDQPFCFSISFNAAHAEDGDEKSLRPLVENPRADWQRESFTCEHLMNHPSIPKWEGIRTGRYTYAKYFERDPPYEFLHDRETDPDQRVNVAGNAEYTHTLQQLRDETESRLADQASARRNP